MEVLSGASHDAVYMADVTSAAMIFVPGNDGINHNEIEVAEQAHIAGGADVLLHAVLARASSPAAAVPALRILSRLNAMGTQSILGMVPVRERGNHQ